MFLFVSQIQGNGFTEVTAEHKKERLVFAVTTYGKIKLQDPTKIFEEINGYWAWLGEEAQDGIWEAYKEIKQILDNATDSFHIARYIKRQIVLMYQWMPMDSFSKWLLTRGNLYIPSDIRDSITEDSRYPRLEQTYLKEDYINLSVMALSIRPVLPIWGEYIDPNRQGDSNDLYKEMEAVGLISETEIVNWPQPNSAFEKLHNYIAITAEDTPTTLGSLWKGIGSTEIPLWLQAKVLVRRLTIVPLCNHDATHSIIANIYRYVKSNLKPTDRRTTDRVNEKRPDGPGSDEDDKTSFLEGYKVKQRVADGDAVLFNVYSENMAVLSQKVDPTMDLRLLERSIVNLQSMEKLQIYEHQILLAQWVLAKGFPPKAFFQVDKRSVDRLLATTQALLWHWGYWDIAVFMQVERIMATVQDIPGITMRPRGGSRIARRFDEELVQLYPHAKPQKVPQKMRDSQVDTINRSANFAAIGINNLTRELMRYNWYYHGPQELKALAEQPEGRGLLVIPPKIKDQITELVIHLAKLNQ